MQIWFLSNGSYSLKKCHNPFGKAIQPPPLTAKFRLNMDFPYAGLPLLDTDIHVLGKVIKKTVGKVRSFGK